MSRYRFTLPLETNRLLSVAKALNERRSRGQWVGHEDGSVSVEGDVLSFPDGDPDQAFLAFVTKHFDDILAAIEERFVIL